MVGLKERALKKERLKKAFPLAEFLPPLTPPNKAERNLAEQFCPQLYVKPSIIEEERNYLTALKNVQLEEVSEALFLLGIGQFPDDTSSFTATMLRLLAPILQGTKMIKRPKWSTVLEIQNKVRELYEKTPERLLRDKVRNLLNNLLPDEKEGGVLKHPPCVIKYRVLRHPLKRMSNFYCIQYFAYWPAQLFPGHLLDYEPVYVFVRKISDNEYEPILITFNADHKFLSSLIPLKNKISNTLEKIISFGFIEDIIRFFRRKQGHIIVTYINWESKVIQITPSEYRDIAEFKAQAYGGKYIYHPISEQREDSDLNRLLSDDESFRLLVPNRWHAYLPFHPPYSKGINKKFKPISCQLHELRTQDLDHIEWELEHPFQAPYLYPGGQEKSPFDITNLCKRSSYQQWREQADDLQKTEVESNLYQVGLLAEFLAELHTPSMKQESDQIWKLIESFNIDFGK